MNERVSGISVDRRAVLASSAVAATGLFVPLRAHAVGATYDDPETRWTVDTAAVEVTPFGDLLLVGDSTSIVAYDWDGNAQWNAVAADDITGIATVDGHVFVGTVDGVECFTATGESRWRFPIGGTITNIIGGSDAVYAVEGGEPNTMYRLFPDGERDWDVDLEAYVYDLAYDGAGCVYTARGYGGVHLNGDAYVGYVHDTGTEEILEHYTGRDRIGTSLTATDDGIFATIGYDGGWSSYSVDNIRFENGREVWMQTEEIAEDVAFRGTNMVLPDPVVIDDAVYCVGRDQHLTKYDLISGDKIWESDRDPHGLAEREGTLLGIVTDDSTRLRSYDPNQTLNWGIEVSDYSGSKYDPTQFGGPFVSPDGSEIALYRYGGSVTVIGPKETTTRAGDSGSETRDNRSDSTDTQDSTETDTRTTSTSDNSTESTRETDSSSDPLRIGDRGLFFPGDGIYSEYLDSMTISVVGFVLSIFGLAYNLVQSDNE